MFVLTFTASVAVTGVFGLYPNSPVTQLYRTVLAQNIAPEFLAPVNGLLGILNVPPIPEDQYQPGDGMVLDPGGWLLEQAGMTVPPLYGPGSTVVVFDPAGALLELFGVDVAALPESSVPLDPAGSIFQQIGLTLPPDSPNENPPDPAGTLLAFLFPDYDPASTSDSSLDPGGILLAWLIPGYQPPPINDSQNPMPDPGGQLLTLLISPELFENSNIPSNPGDVILSWLFPPASEPPLPSEQDVVNAAMVSVAETQTQFATMTSLASSSTLAPTQISISTLTPNPSPSVTTSPISTATITWLLPTSTKPPPPPPTSTFTPTVTPTFTPSPPCSISSSTAANVTFTNSSSTETVNIHWVDYACNVTLYATLAPGQSLGVGTYLTHAWRFTNTSTGQLIGDHVVSAPGVVDIWSGSLSISGDFSVSSVSLNGGGSSIVVSPGQTVNVTYNFNVWDDPCPGCFTQLVTGLGTAGTHGGSCAFDGDAALYPGTSGVEDVNLTAPLVPGIYNVAVSYQWQFTCADALTAYAGGTAIGQIEVLGPSVVLYEGGTSDGNIGPRASADAVCAANLPPGYVNYHAFIAYSAFDSIANMPANYGIPTNIPVYSASNILIANNWADLTDGTIATTLISAGVASNSYWWSGVDDASGVHTDGVTPDCLDWTSNSNSDPGTLGSSLYIDSNWMYYFSNASCQPVYSILCVGY